jgi:hypothetical protein
MTATADPSLRHVLPDGAPYVRNLAALWMLDPKLARAIEALPEGSEYATEPSKAGPPTVIVPTRDGRRVYMHSRYQPIEEAKRLVDPIKFDECVSFYIHGTGLGYHLEMLFDRASEEAMIAIMEPDLRMLRTMFMQRDLSRIMSSRRVMFFWELEKSDLFMRLTPRAALTTMGFESVTHAPSLQLHSAFHQQMQTWIGEFAAYCRTNFNTLVLNGKRTAENISRNVGWYSATPGIGRLKDRYRGKPAIVVSAGPSLRKNKHLLKDVQDKAVIVAVQTTLQPLLEMGVEPHFVTSLDYHQISTRFYEKLPRSMRTELVAEPKATEAIFSMYPGPLSILGNEFAASLLREMKLDRGTLPAGATVAHLAYYLAEHLGCDPVIFVGQDLGFSDGLAYLPGTSYEQVWRPELGRFCTMEMKQWEQIVRDRPILRRIPDYEGRPMYTEERLFTYLQQFERDFARAQVKIIDATEGGAMKRGAAPMKLADAIATYCTHPVERLTDHPGLDWSRLGDCIRCIENRRDEAREIERISIQTLPLLEEIRDHLDDQARVNRAIAKIDALRAKMNEVGGCYELVMQLSQTSEMQRFQADRKILAAKVSGAEKQKRQVGRDVDNVRSVIAAAKVFQTLMDEVIHRLTVLQQERGATR